MILVGIYVAFSICVGIVIGAFEWTERHNTSIVLDAIMGALIWPCAIIAALYIVIDDHVMDWLHRNEKRDPP